MTSSNNFYLLDSVSAIWCHETPSTAELSSFMTLSFFEQINWLNNTICGNDTYASLIAHIQTMVLLMNSPTINYFIYFECYEISAHRQTTEKKLVQTAPNGKEEETEWNENDGNVLFLGFCFRLCPPTPRRTLTFICIARRYSASLVSPVFWTLPLLRLRIGANFFHTNSNETIDKCPACRRF